MHRIYNGSCFVQFHSTTTIGTTLQSHTRLNTRKLYLNYRTHVHNNNDDIFVVLVFQTIIVSTQNGNNNKNRPLNQLNKNFQPCFVREVMFQI